MERSGTMMSQDVVEGRKGGAMILWCFVDMRGKYRCGCCSMRNYSRRSLDILAGPKHGAGPSSLIPFAVRAKRRSAKPYPALPLIDIPLLT